MQLGVSNILDPDQARHFVGPELGPNCLQRLSTGHLSHRVLPLLAAKSYAPKFPSFYMDHQTRSTLAFNAETNFVV